MPSDLRKTWNNERWVIARLVETVERGDDEGKKRCGQRLLCGYDENGWRSYREVEEGAFLSLAQLAPAGKREELAEAFEGEICTGRLDALASGAAMTASETVRWLDHAASYEVELDWAVVAPGHSQHLYMACTRRSEVVHGWGWTGAGFVAAWASLPEAMNSLKQVGFTSERDFQARRPRLLGGPLRI